MATVTIEEQLEALTKQVVALTAELEAQRAAADRRAELMADLTPIASDALARLGAELERGGLTSEDLAALARGLARAVPDLKAVIDQLPALADLARTAGPITEPALTALTDRLVELERRGYFDLARSAAGVVDNVVTAFGPDDVEALGDNVVLILNTIKEMTQPEVMQLLQRTVHTVQDATEPVEPPSLLAIARELRQPDVRRGLYRLLTALRSMGSADAQVSTTESQPKGGA